MKEREKKLGNFGKSLGYQIDKWEGRGCFMEWCGERGVHFSCRALSACGIRKQTALQAVGLWEVAQAHPRDNIPPFWNDDALLFLPQLCVSSLLSKNSTASLVDMSLETIFFFFGIITKILQFKINLSHLSASPPNNLLHHPPFQPHRSTCCFPMLSP